VAIGWGAGGTAAVSHELAQVGGGEPGRHGLEPGPGQQQMNDRGVGPQADRHTGVGAAEPELLTADGEVARGRDDAGRRRRRRGR
jgi:hypothetical protein